MSTSANSSSGMLAFTSDNESMLILAPPANSTETANDFNARLETMSVQYLASGASHDIITQLQQITIPPGFQGSTGITGPAASNLTVTQLSKNDREQFDIETTNDVSDISFALMTNYDSCVQPTPDSATYDIGTNNQSVSKSFSVITPTNSIYDSHVKFDSVSNTGPFYSTSSSGGDTDSTGDTGSTGYEGLRGLFPVDINGTIPNKGSWEITFDETNTNANYSKAINSEYNTINGERPIRVEEFDSFNKNYALGMDLLSESNEQNYFTLDNVTGEPIPNSISNTGGQSTPGNYMSPSYRLYNNGLYAIKSNDFSTISSEHYGSYRVQQFPDMALVTITEDDNTNVSTSQDEIDNFPIFNANNTESLPTNTISLGNFYSIFDREAESIVPNYKYTVTVTESTNSGYSPAQDMSLRTDEDNTFTLDDNSLLNNRVYMEHYVNGTHTLTFTPATLSIEPVSTASTSNLDYFDLNEQRETLSEEIFNNGQIKINNNTPTTRYVTDNSSTLSITPNVFYKSEDSKEGITNELETNYSVTYLSQLIAKNSQNIDCSFMKDSGSQTVALDLYNGSSISNSYFRTSDFEFTALNSTINDDAEVYRITPSKQLASINGFSSVAINGTTTPVTLVSAFATVQNLATMVDTNNVFDTAKMLFSLKNLSDSKIYSDATNKGWNISIPDNYQGKMVSSSISAYASNNICFPSLEQTKNLINNNGEINYKISINTVNSGDSDNMSSSSHLSDYVNIEWSTDNFISNNNSIIISQELLTRTQSQANTTPVEVTSNLRLSGKLQGKTVKVYRVTSQRQIKYTFDLPLRPFTGLTMTTPDITVNTIYYIVKDVVTDEYYPNSYLQYISDDLSTDYTLVRETFSSVTSVTGSFNSTDLCDMFVKVQGKDINSNNIIDLTNQYSVSSMFGVEITMELKSIAEQIANQNGDIKLSMEVEYLSSSGEEGEVIFDNVSSGYVLQLTNKYNTNYTVDYWSANILNITSKTNIACDSNTLDYSNKSLTVTDGYANINTWNTTDYYIKVSYELSDQSTTVLSIYKNGSPTALYEIRTKNFTFLNVQAFISNIPKDIYRVDRWIGQNQTTSDITFSEKFMIIDYTYVKNSVNETNVFEIDTGIYLTKSGLSATSFRRLSDIGKYIKFTLKGDSIGVNMVDDVNGLNENVYIETNDTITIPNHTISNHGWSFQYINNGEVSRVLTINRYRGFYGPSTQADVQIYKIVRDVQVATLTIPRTTTNTTYPNTISQSFNVYYNKQYSIDNLSGNVGSINLYVKFLISMLDSTDTSIFTIYTMGDDVSFTIVNPNSTGLYRRAPNDTTLKSFILDTFSGSNFNNTENPLSINSYRLKIQSDNECNTFSNTTASWSIELASKNVTIYKNSCYLGNPENLDTNDAFIQPDETKWENIYPDKLFSYNDLISTGISIGPWIIKRFNNSELTELTNYDPSISFFVIIPPYLIFKQVKSNTLSLPYEFVECDLQSSYLPVAETIEETNIYNPFSASTTYDYIATTNGVSNVTVSFNQSKMNDITFIQTSAESLISNYVSSTRSVATQHFVVEGNLLKISLFIGLKTQIGSEIATMFANEDGEGLPANRLMFCNNMDSYFYMDSLSSDNSGIVLKLLQPLNTNTPYPNLSISEVFSSNATENANVTIQIDNFFLLANSLKLDLPTGQGTKVSMFTHEVISNTDGSVDIFVYKYKAINNIDYVNVKNNGSPADSLQSVALTFLQREYKQVSISSAEYASAFTKLNTSGPNTKLNQSFDAFITSKASNFDSLPWVLDTNWPDANLPYNETNSIYANISCLTEYAQTNILPKVFATRTDGKAKVFMVHKYPIFTVLDKLGRKTFQITGWGSTVSSSIATSGVSLSRFKNESTTGNFSNILQSHAAGWSLNSIPHPHNPL
jgi:hypothetical protein